MRPWTSALSQSPFVSVFTGSSHSAFLATIPFGEDRKIRFLPMMSVAEVIELFQHPASPVRAGEVLVRDPAALTDVASMVQELTGGNARHVFLASDVDLGGGELALSPSKITGGYFARFERTLRTALEGHWEAHASQAHSRQLTPDAREKHLEILRHFLRSPNKPVARAVARTFSDSFMDWGALTVDRATEYSTNPAVTFVSPIARTAVLRTWLRQVPLSAGRVAFEQEVRRLAA